MLIVVECLNCKMICDQPVCKLCLKLPRCTGVCRRYLGIHLFDDDSTCCRTCTSKSQRVPNRSAFNELVQEVDIPITDGDADLDVFLQKQRVEIDHILNRAIEQNK